MTKVIILNGPPDCGKTTASNAIWNEILCATMSFKEPLYEALLAFFPIKEEDFWEDNEDKVLKEQPHKDLKITPLAMKKAYDFNYELFKSCPEKDGMYLLSPRQAQIFIAEVIMKPMLGERIFGEAVSTSILGDFWEEDIPSITIVDGGGFPEEIVPIVEAFGEDNVHIVRIFRTGCNFDNDSRDYLPLEYEGKEWPKFNLDIYNTGTEEEFHQELIRSIKGLVGVK